ncbi:GntR family transcriptional regulator [Leisingera daeponensis]|uniref:GntR family transcriptional regulator n=1 Tax=Leisingera daeponensis TaxID=405746 RepID=UPI001C9770D0|nr:GntR family transcriptional regulator [Leisingera daeponensis]MBY6058768.1 GntR family transcriptional regulator [Leisingera daeponensis]
MRNVKPRYVTIAETLEKEVQQLAPNSLMPTEDQMAKRFEVSRITVRAALELLENSGLISRLRGRGTIVSPKKLVRNFSPFLGFEADMKLQGIDFVTKVLSFESSMLAPVKIANQLQLPENSKVGRISLIRLVNDQVICHDHRYYPEAIAKKIDPKKAETATCSGIVQSAAGTKIRQVHWDSEILSASQEVAAALGIANRTLVFTSNYIWYASNRVPIETGLVSYRVDRCKFRFKEQLHETLEEGETTSV